MVNSILYNDYAEKKECREGMLTTLIERINQKICSLEASGYISLQACTQAVKENLDHNTEKIVSWIIDSESREAATFEYSHDFVIGLGVTKNNNQPYYKLKKSHVVLVKSLDATTPFLVLTSFPMIRSHSLKGEEMQELQYFCTHYFNQTFYFDELDNMLAFYQDKEAEEISDAFIAELYHIIQTKRYDTAARIFKNYGTKLLDVNFAEIIIKHMYHYLLDQPTTLDLKLFFKECLVVFCPFCSGEPNLVPQFNLVEQATIEEKNISFYVCKACEIVWTSTEINCTNPIRFSQFMESIGLPASWNGIKVDIV